jgi:hypothetical protein
LAEEAELNQSMRHYTIEVVFIGHLDGVMAHALI